MKRKSLILTAMIFLCAACLFAGVRQNRVSNTTNIGTNPYANMQAPNYTVVGDYGSGVNYDGTVPTDGYYYDNSAYGATAPPGSLIPMGTILQYIPSSAIPVTVDRNRYYYDSNVYFAEVFDGGAIVYQVVPAPMGAVISTLPQGCFARTYDGKSVMICGNTVYMQVAGGYQVIATQ